MFAQPTVAWPLGGKGNFELLASPSCDSSTVASGRSSGLIVAWLLHGEGRTKGSYLAQLWSSFCAGNVGLRGLICPVWFQLDCFTGRVGFMVLTESCCHLATAQIGWGLGLSPILVATWSLQMMDGAQMACLAKL